jgi:hypothetical protein
MKYFIPLNTIFERTSLPKMALRKQAVQNKEETPAKMAGDARVIFVHRS